MMFHPAAGYVSFERRRNERIAAFAVGLALGLATHVVAYILGV